MAERQQTEPDLWDRVVNTIDAAARPLARAETDYLSTHPGYGNLSPAGFANNVARVAPPSSRTINALKDQQAQFDAVERANAWANRAMLGPVLAPPLVALAFGAAGLPAREAEPLAQDLMGREPWMRGGNTRQIQVGKRAHAAFEEQLAAKPVRGVNRPYPSWKYEQRLPVNGRTLKPDGASPGRPGSAEELESRRFLELKPNTPSGRAAGRRRIELLKSNGYNARAVYYDPQTFELEHAVIPPRVRPVAPSLRLFPAGFGGRGEGVRLGSDPRRDR